MLCAAATGCSCPPRQAWAFYLYAVSDILHEGCSVDLCQSWQQRINSIPQRKRCSYRTVNLLKGGWQNWKKRIVKMKMKKVRGEKQTNRLKEEKAGWSSECATAMLKGFTAISQRRPRRKRTWMYIDGSEKERKRHPKTDNDRQTGRIREVGGGGGGGGEPSMTVAITNYWFANALFCSCCCCCRRRLYFRAFKNEKRDRQYLCKLPSVFAI